MTSSEQKKTVSAFEYSKTYKRAIQKRCARNLPSGKMIDEDIPGTRKVYHACAEEIQQEIALAVWASFGDEIVMVYEETDGKGRWRAENKDITLLARKTLNKYAQREYRIQSNIAFKGVDEVMDKQEQEYADDTFFDKLDSALLVEDMLSYMPEETAKVMVMYHDLGGSLRGISEQTGLHRTTVVKRLEQGANVAKHYMHREDEETYRPWTEYHGKKKEA